MPYAASIQSTTGSIATYAKRMAGKPAVEIILENHTEGKAYTTLDAISGKVNITAPHNARFDEIKITLEGVTKTYVESLAPHSTRSRTNATHNFLKLVMPIKESDYPHPRIAEAGRTYTFPFNFVIPDQLLPRACCHACASTHVHQAHIQLPPSLGDREVSHLDDFSPEMAKTTYSIKVKVTQHRERDDKEMVLVEGQKKILVIPAVPEAPPMSTGDGFDEYVLSKTKSLKKGVFSGKLGRITVSAAQTGAFMLPSPSSSSSSATTKALINLRFDPHDASCEPPRLGGLTSKIRSTTFFAARPSPTLPTRIGMTSQFETHRGVYATSTPLSSRCVEGVNWFAQTSSSSSLCAPERRGSDSSTSSDSSCSSSSSPSPTPGGKGEDNEKSESKYHTAQIIVPLLLPPTKFYPPTFHSCIVSRVYTLSLTLTIHTPSASLPNSSVTLHLPVQIGADGNVQGEREEMTDAERERELVDAEGFFIPRITRMDEVEPEPADRSEPESSLVQMSVGDGIVPGHVAARGAPPSYEAFVGVGRSEVEPGRG